VAEGKNASDLSPDETQAGAALRGLIWHESGSGEHYATAAGIVLLGKDPSAVFPQCRILADAYRGKEADGDPGDQEDIRGPMPVAIDRAIAFVDRNTRHPMRVVGLNRVRLDEYPVEALREALVNAVAHRNYEDAGRKIMLEVFGDRVVISSPGLPPAPITLATLRSGKYKPCSRNPVIAQCLSYFHRIEERGSGFRRMKDGMLNHGLDQPRLATDTGYFQVIFPGPADNLDRLRVPPSATGRLVTPAVEAKLNERQRKMVALLVEGEELTSRRCEKEFGITRETATKDFELLMDLGIVERKGAGRSTRYVIALVG
jgi:predicted HTH transcriptional regulator